MNLFSSLLNTRRFYTPPGEAGNPGESDGKQRLRVKDPL
jgi:hypothetical protein